MKKIPLKLKVLNIIMLVALIPLLVLALGAAYYTLIGHELFVLKFGDIVATVYPIFKIFLKDDLTVESARFIFLSGSLLSGITVIVTYVLKERYIFQLLGFKLIKPKKSNYEKNKEAHEKEKARLHKDKEKELKKAEKEKAKLEKEKSKESPNSEVVETTETKTTTEYKSTSDRFANKFSSFKK